MASSSNGVPYAASKYKYVSLDNYEPDVQHFLTTQQLDKAITFAKTDSFVSYSACGAWIVAALSAGLSCLAPVALFCPRRVTQHYELKLDQDSLAFNSAVNDCCTHVARTTRTVPLDKVQDVQLQEGCCETLFGLKTLQVQTAGMNGPSGAPEVSARFLRNPEQAREAIQLAVKLSRARALSPPQQMLMAAGGATAVQAGRADAGAGVGSSAVVGGGAGAGGVGSVQGREGTMRERLERLAELRSMGVLSAREVDNVRAKVLAASKDYTLSLFEAQQLLSEGLVGERDFKAIREELLAQIQACSS